MINAIRRDRIKHHSGHSTNCNVDSAIQAYLLQHNILTALWWIAVTHKDTLAQRVFHTESMAHTINRSKS